MSLRDCVSRFCMFVKRHDWLFRFFGQSVVLSAGDIEKRERLIQTYLIVFGLFLSYDHDVALQSVFIRYFVMFFLCALIYYSTLVRPLFPFLRATQNFCAVMMGVFFSYAFVSCLFSFKGVGGILDLFAEIVFLVLIAFFVAYPLLV